MEIERHQPQSTSASAVAIDIDTNTDTGAELHKPTILKSLPHLLLSIILLLIGGTGSTLILRVYFLHGGNRQWLSSFLQTAAFPFLLLPLFFSFLYQRLYKPSTAPKLFHLTPFFLLCSIGLGLLTGIDNLMFSYGVSYLPASTVSLLNSTFLAFTAFFAYLIVRQRFTASSINAVVLLICGAVVLGVHANGDRPEGQSMGKYFAGYALTLGAAMLYGLVLPLVELMYAKSKQIITFTLVLEMQFVISATASTFCAVGMAVNKDFQAISKEAHLYGLGETKYYVVIISVAIITQCVFLGMIGTVNYSSALLAGILISICTPLIEVFAVFFFHEKFDGEKGVALALSLWGMASYFYGDYKNYKKSKATTKKARVQAQACT